MFIAIDVGNSNAVYGFFSDEGQLVSVLRIDVSFVKTSNQFSVMLQDYLLEQKITVGQISGVGISSVVPFLTSEIEQSCHLLRLKSFTIDYNCYPSLPVITSNPIEIGTDLVCNATYVYTAYKKSCIVVDFGTALTFTTINDFGKILGVSIAPGIKTAINALFNDTAKLPDVPLEYPASVFGNDTPTAIQTGVLHGYENLVIGMVNKIKSELNSKEVMVIGTGGLVEAIPPLKEFFDKTDKEITLKGIKKIYELVQ